MENVQYVLLHWCVLLCRCFSVTLQMYRNHLSNKMFYKQNVALYIQFYCEFQWRNTYTCLISGGGVVNAVS